MTTTPAETGTRGQAGQAGRGVGRRQLIAGAAMAAMAMATGTGTSAAAPGDGGVLPAGGGIAPHYTAGTPDTVYQNIDGTSFTPEDSASTYSGANYNGIYATAGSRAFSALLDLPQGATITELVFAVVHNDTSAMDLSLLSFSAGISGGVIADTTYSTQSVSTVNVSVPITSGTLAVVDNSRYTYVVRWIPGTAAPTSILGGARVGYTLPSKAQVYGAAANGTGVYGTTATGSYAVAGHASQNVGVYGLSDGGTYPYGVLGQNTAPGGFSLFGNASAAGSVAFGGTAYGTAVAGQFIGPVNVYGQITLLQQTQPPVGTVNAFIVGPGVTKNAAVELPDGTHGLMHCVEAPEPWFEDFGEGTLVAGKADVKLEAAFAHTVNTDTLHVFLTPHDEHHLHVSQRNAGGFAVTAAPSTTAAAAGKKVSDLNGTFTWRVVAKRRDVKGDRLMRVELPKPIEAKIPPMPKP